MSDEHRLLPRFRVAQRTVKQERVLARLVLETGEAPKPTGTAGGDPMRLRGIPAIGRNVAGAVPGTQPERELLRERRR